MVEVIILAIALSMDAFAVSIGLGSKRPKTINSLAFKSAMYFGILHCIMPLIGYWGGKTLLIWADQYARWIAFSILLLIGVKIIYQSLSNLHNKIVTATTHKVMLALAIATSIDAMAASVTLPLLSVNPYLAITTIGLTTFLVSWVGVIVGAKSDRWLGRKAELFGGIMLIVIGFKILLF
jgi:putative Mn2+ efflux pump MntP